MRLAPAVSPPCFWRGSPGLLLRAPFGVLPPPSFPPKLAGVGREATGDVNTRTRPGGARGPLLDNAPYHYGTIRWKHESERYIPVQRPTRKMPEVPVPSRAARSPVATPGRPPACVTVSPPPRSSFSCVALAGAYFLLHSRNLRSPLRPADANWPVATQGLGAPHPTSGSRDWKKKFRRGRAAQAGRRAAPAPVNPARGCLSFPWRRCRSPSHSPDRRADLARPLHPCTPIPIPAHLASDHLFIPARFFLPLTRPRSGFPELPGRGPWWG